MAVHNLSKGLILELSVSLLYIDNIVTLWKQVYLLFLQQALLQELL